MATITMYGNFANALGQKLIDLDSDTIKVALTTSSYTPNKDTHDFFNDVTNEVSGTGYTAGGATLGSVTWTYNSGTDTWTFDAADTTWATSTITARYAVIYDSTPGTAATNPLIAYVDFVTDQTSSGAAFTLTWSGSGIFTVTL